MRSYKWWSVFNKVTVAASIMLCCTAFHASAVVNAEKTRVVFNSGSIAESLSLVNSEKEPVVVQVWTDNGDPTVSPDQLHTPVVINPPVFKMKPGEIRNIRLLLVSAGSLPQDRESIYWLNIYQIPPNTETQHTGEKKIVLPLKIRMKVFVRPEKIGELQENDAQKLQFSIDRESGNKTLLIQNPTPWHLTLSSLRSGKTALPGVMVAPFTSERVEITADKTLADKVEYDVINDNGTRWQGSQKLK
ncbi:fimbria/pilus periplasmic chaperone [Rahnella sp. FC061912-K]|uniref:fimbria/pilus periplasmic chaperone n=1 Tax=Rahnella rivi TaxID=2816249 RepID=UPI001C26CE1C|nr:fimbria/pilus periplasmic chaperone [Rahnella rivi]MBU9829918.1 fimbria/pilus periplasmic chaperone [Rahnella rivi]